MSQNDQDTKVVYVVMVHPPDTNSHVADVYCDAQVARDKHDEIMQASDSGIEVVIRMFTIEA